MFQKLMVANRGEIACRIIKTARKLGVKTLAIYSDSDKNSAHALLADEAFYIGASEASKSYLNIKKILEVAVERNVDAIHPGYGFLAENPVFAQRLEDEGITFIGPSPDVLRLLGDKITARDAMTKAGIPVAMGSDGPISEPKEASEQAEEIGYPVIIKAAAGGGGIGMQVVESPDDFDKALRLCQGRALSAFGDDRVFLEKFIKGAQHIEFQVLGDGKKAIHFGERFCSIQRRHQKILEEGPWLSEEVRSELGSKVVAGAEAVGYKGLATFEFLRDDNGEFFFLEVNPRVQVEHTVTEMITGYDLVSLGIRIAAGESLPISQDEVEIKGHAIQVRVNAENPSTLTPSPGRLWECHWPGGPGIRIDSHAHTGYDMPAVFDSLLSKIISWGSDRDQAISRMEAALSETILLGVDTLIPLHQEILKEEDFLNRDVTIRYLEEHPDLVGGGN